MRKLDLQNPHAVRKAFRRWLKSLHPRTKVGVCQESGACPLARFATIKTGQQVEVGTGSRALNDLGQTVIFFGDWGRTFAQRVDIGYRDKAGSVSAGHALTILDSIAA